LALKSLITGGAGFIGSNLAKKLVEIGDEVVVIDDFSSGNIDNLQGLEVEIVEADIRNERVINFPAFEKADRIFHLAANVDNRFSWQDPKLSLRSNIEGTINIGLACQKHGINQLVYSSTGTVYGDLPNPPYRESEQTSQQTTLYGATKYAAEGILSVFSTHFGIDCLILRFVGVLGPNISHGHLFDFMRKLRSNPDKLMVLGDGNQKKAYVDVDDVVSGLLIPFRTNFEVFNLGRPDFSTVKDSVRWLCEELEISPDVEYEERDRGWIGDNPNLYLDIQKLSKLGWKPERTIEESVKRTVRWLANNPHRLDLSNN
jgi:UDP-glucose 4-epimerase